MSWLSWFNHIKQYHTTNKDFRKHYHNEILLLNNKHKTHNDNPSILYFGITRTGTCQTTEILSHLAREQSMTCINLEAFFWNMGKDIENDADRRDIYKSSGRERKMYKEYGYFYGPIKSFRFTKEPLPFNKFKIILQLRDPRDILVSLYFSHAYSHPPRPNRDSAYYEQFLAHRKKLQSMPIDEFVLQRAPFVYSHTYLPLCQHLFNMPNTLFMKYEELVTDFPKWLDRVICFLDFKIGQDVKLQIIQKAKVLLTVEKEDIFAHKRQMKPGDHKRKLRKETIKKLNAMFSEALNLLGYSK